MRVLLTGGSGFIGGRLLQILEKLGEDTVRLATRNPARTSQDLHLVDWASDTDLLAACQDIDVVIHLAGMDAQDCASDPIAALAFNGLATARLLRAATRSGVRRFIYMSSAHVYGAALRGNVDETTCPLPRHPYATSHRAAEDVVRAAHAAESIEGVVLRLSNGFGFPANANKGCWKVIVNEFCLKAVQDRKIILRSDGTQKRDFMPASEVCRAIHHFMQLSRPDLGEGLFNLGSGTLRSLREVCELVADRINGRLNYRPAVEFGRTTDLVGSELQNYSVERLLDAGFNPNPIAFDNEMHALIDFCAGMKW